MITTRPFVFAKGSAATNWSSHTSLFLKKDGGAGEGKNFSSREKKFFLSPASPTFIGNSAKKRENSTPYKMAL